MTPDPPRGQGPRGLVILCPGVKLRCPPVQNLNEPPDIKSLHLKFVVVVEFSLKVNPSKMSIEQVFLLSSLTYVCKNLVLRN